MKERKFLLPFLIILATLVILTFLLKGHQDLCPLCHQLKLFAPAAIKHYILGFGPWAIGVFIGLYTLNTISLLPPIGIMSLVAGFIFGPLLGTIGIMTGSFLGTSATFFISRVFGRSFVEKIIRGKAKDFEERLNKRGFVTILFLRLIPIIPWEVVNYASGLTRIQYKDFMLATLIGIFPSVVVQTFFSDRLSNFNIRDPKLIAAILGFVVLIFVPAIYLAVKKGAKGAGN